MCRFLELLRFEVGIYFVATEKVLKGHNIAKTLGKADIHLDRQQEVQQDELCRL
jgi:hypothetical protein